MIYTPLAVIFVIFTEVSFYTLTFIFLGYFFAELTKVSQNTMEQPYTIVTLLNLVPFGS